MSQNKENAKYYYLILSMYLAGIIGLYFPSSRPYFQLFTPLHILAVCFFVFWGKKIPIKYLAAISFAGYVVEVIGVKTGLLFGVYQYDFTLGPKILDVPPLIGINWLIMTYCTASVIGQYFNSWHSLAKAILVAISMTLFDFMVEPVAIALNMWHWQSSTIPTQNYIAWFGFSLLFGLATFYSKIPLGKDRTCFVLTLQWVFFLSIGLLLRLYTI